MKKPKKKIKLTPFNNAVSFRMHNRQMTIIKTAADSYTIETKILVIADDKLKEEYIKSVSSDCIFKHRPHSKFCIWHNKLTLSRIAFECLFLFKSYIDTINIAEKEATE